jgi:hypothetical protein
LDFLKSRLYPSSSPAEVLPRHFPNWDGLTGSLRPPSVPNTNGGQPFQSNIFSSDTNFSVINVARGKPIKVYIQQDEKWPTGNDKGVDVRLNAQGRSYMDANLSRMYYPTANSAFGSQTVTLIPTDAGLTANCSTFGNNCQMKFTHL